MRTLAWVAGLLGVLAVLVGVLGALRGSPWTVTILGVRHAPSTVVILGNTMLLAGVWLGVLGSQKKD